MRTTLRQLSLTFIALLTACGTNPNPTPGTTDTTPAAPTEVRATPGAGIVTVSWKDNSEGETGFVIYREPAARLGPQSFTEVGRVGADVTVFEDKTAVGANRYAVAAENEDGKTSTLVEQEGEAVAPTPAAPGNPNEPPVISTFTADAEDNLATFVWDISDADGDSLTCTLDVNDDGAPEYTVPDCDRETLQSHTYASIGNYTAKLTVSDGSESAQASSDVNITSLPPLPETVTGTITDFVGGAGDLRAEINDPETFIIVVLGSATVTEDGTFNLELPGKLQDSYLEEAKTCAEEGAVTVSPPDARTATLGGGFSLYRNGAFKGFVTLSTPPDPEADVTETVMWQYADKDVVIEGVCNNVIQQRYDLSLKAGWNKVVVKETRDGNDLIIDHQTRPLPLDIKWYLSTDIS